MAEFSMNAEIALKANAAIKSIQQFNKEAKNSQKEFSLLGRTISLDTSRMNKNLAAISLIAGGFFAKIISQSPHVRAEFKRLEASTLLFNVAIGEHLQPTIEILVDSIITLQNKFLAIDPLMQEFIITTGALTVALSAATIAAVALWVALGPITLVILGVATVIAFLLTFDAGLRTFGEVFIVIGEAISFLVSDSKDALDGWIEDLFGQFGVVGGIVGDLVSIIVDALLFLPLTGVEIVATIMQIFGDMMVALSALFKGDFGGVADAIANMFLRVINLMIRTLNNFLISPINSALSAVDKAAETFGGDVNFRISDIPEIPARQEGGEVRRDGLIFAHRGEEIATKSETRTNRRGGGGAQNVTNNFYNTFKIGSVDSKKRIREMMRESERMSKRNMDRRLKT